MRAALLTLTRDRLEYTRHCFATLEEHAGCAYDHYVLDQGSADGTAEWLRNNTDVILHESPHNIGICRGLNHLLDGIRAEAYDMIVRYDNDCELVQGDTLKTVCEVAFEYEAIVAPRVNGLINPPPILGLAKAGSHTIEETPILGGIFMGIPSNLFYDHGFRYDETMPNWAGDEAIVPWWRARGGTCGYLQDVSVNHYLTSVGQKTDQPAYETRKTTEINGR